MIRYTCPKCRAALDSPMWMVGQASVCPACGSRNVVPATASVAGGAGPAAPQSAAGGAISASGARLGPQRGRDLIEKCQELRQASTEMIQKEMYEKARSLLRQIMELCPADPTAAQLLAALPDRIKERDGRHLVASAKEQLSASHCSVAIELLMQARTLAPNPEIETLLAQARRRRWRKWGLEAAAALLIGILIWQSVVYAGNARRLRDANNCLAQGNLPAAAQMLDQSPSWLAFGKSDLERRLREAWVSQVENLTGQGQALEALALADEGRKARPDEPRLDYLGDKDRAAAHVQALNDQMRKIIDGGGMDNARSPQALAVAAALDRLASTPRAGELRRRITDRLAALQAKSDFEAALQGYDQTQLSQLAAAAWAKVQQTAAEARVAGTDWTAAKGKFDEARALLPMAAVAAQTESDRQAAAQAQADYETALHDYDPARLAQYASADWAKVQQAVTAARDAGTDWKAAKNKYDEARALLPAVAAAAQTEMARQQTAAAEAKTAYETALRGYDPARLAQYASVDWAKVQQDLTAARDAGTDWKAAKNKYDEARALLPAVAAAAQTEMARQQTAAAEAKAAYDTALRGYDPARLAQFASADWANVLQAVAEAKAAGTDFKTAKTKYDEARALLPTVEAAAQTEMDRQAAAKAKTDYETALRAYDRPRLEQFGGSDWQRVQQAARAGDNAGQDWITVALQYDRARALLAAADRTAAAAEAEAARREKISDLLATAMANDSREKGPTALAALEELLRLDPQNSRALALRTKITNYYPPDLLVAPFTAQAARDFQQRWADHLNTPTQVTNTIGLKLALLPAGAFTMGTPAGETGRLADEGPPHKVTLTKGFFMGLTEVTQAQWKAVMGADSNPAHFTGDDLPVENVSWNDAVDFCAKLSLKEGKSYRLPTEAEWEYACRAGTNGPFHTGQGEESLKQATWLAGNSGDQTHPAGQKAANAFGLYDVHGNVSEWCADWYGDYPQADQTDPIGPAKGSFRVLRGGSWSDAPQFCRAGYRFWDAPAYRNSHSGFRVVLDANH